MNKQKNEFLYKELSDLDYNLAKLICPKLKAFRNMFVTFPEKFDSAEKWGKCLDKMIRAFEIIIEDSDKNDANEPDFDVCTPKGIKKAKQRKKGLKLFAKYFDDLWFT